MKLYHIEVFLGMIPKIEREKSREEGKDASSAGCYIGPYSKGQKYNLADVKNVAIELRLRLQRK